MRLFLLPVCLIAFACNNSGNKNQPMDSYVEKEIRDRVKSIQQLNQEKDTVIIDPVAVEKKVAELILLSKDIENLSAAVSLANAYFDEKIRLHRMNTSDIKMLTTGMHADDMASALKQNEMVLFNHVLLKVSNNAVPLHAAQ